MAGFAAAPWLGIFLFRGNILRRSLESGAQQPNFRRCELDARRPLLSPGAGARIEHAWRFVQKVPLLLWRELHHPMLVVGITERGKNPTADPKIRVIHVRRLNRSGNLESQTAKSICGHGKTPFRLTSSATAATWRADCNRDAPPPFAAARDCVKTPNWRFGKVKKWFRTPRAPYRKCGSRFF